MRKSIRALTLISVIALNGCATPYQPMGSKKMGGFSESIQPTGEYVVSFLGNNATPTKFLVDYALLRSAELTLANSKKYFAVLYRLPSGNASFMSVSPDGVPYLIVDRSRVFLTIQLLDDDVTPGPKDKVFNAQELANEIRLRHR
jgi:hypothetical protein